MSAMHLGRMTIGNCSAATQNLKNSMFNKYHSIMKVCVLRTPTTNIMNAILGGAFSVKLVFSHGWKTFQPVLEGHQCIKTKKKYKNLKLRNEIIIFVICFVTCIICRNIKIMLR